MNIDPTANRLDSLSLRVCKGRSPFALCHHENLFGPDDWAWQFLRLNDGYGKAFAKAITTTQKPGKGPPTSYRKSPATMFPHEVACRDVYGLSTWLNPERATLPKCDGSWFFPLRAVTNWPVDAAMSPLQIGRFGYSRRYEPIKAREMFALEGENFDVDRASRSEVVSFMVDVSVPPIAQLNSIEAACRALRFHSDCKYTAGPQFRLYDRRGRRVPYKPEPARPLIDDDLHDLRPISVWPQADVRNQPYPLAKPDWRVVSVDIHRPIRTQIDKLAPALRKASELVSSKVPSGHWPRTYKLSIQSKSKEKPTPTDGHFLKALVVVKQLSLMGLKAKDIEAELLLYCNKVIEEDKLDLQHFSIRQTDKWSDWIADRPNRIHRLIGQVDEVISGGYRWLVHADRP